MLYVNFTKIEITIVIHCQIDLMKRHNVETMVISLSSRKEQLIELNIFPFSVFGFNPKIRFPYSVRQTVKIQLNEIKSRARLLEECNLTSILHQFSTITVKERYTAVYSGFFGEDFNNFCIFQT